MFGKGHEEPKEKPLEVPWCDHCNGVGYHENMCVVMQEQDKEVKKSDDPDEVKKANR